jgi:hypothetical protein
MSELTKTEEVTQTELTPEQKSLAQVNQVVSNAVAALMDVANLLRDIPKLVAANVQLASELAELKK